MEITAKTGASERCIDFNIRNRSTRFATSGWNYTASSSFITLSFWVRSVAQHFMLNYSQDM